MRLAVIADIHGNYQALTAVLEDIASCGADHIINLGDAVGYGPEPEAVVTALIGRGIPSVKGNHELALSDEHYFHLLNPTCQWSLQLTRELLSAQSLAWLNSLPATIVRGSARFLHGCPPNSITEYLFNPSTARLSRIFAGYPESICFVGHTHQLQMFTCNARQICSLQVLEPGVIEIEETSRYLLCCGSVGQPRDEVDRRAKYGLWDDRCHQIEIRAVPYDVATTVRLIRERGFPDVNARRLQ